MVKIWEEEKFIECDLPDFEEWAEDLPETGKSLEGVLPPKVKVVCKQKPRDYFRWGNCTSSRIG